MSIDVATARAHHQELQKLVGTELETVTTFLMRLMKFERERMHERLGYASMWEFCRRGLGLCESTTDHRTCAWRGYSAGDTTISMRVRRSAKRS